VIGAMHAQPLCQTSFGVEVMRVRRNAFRFAEGLSFSPAVAGFGTRTPPGTSYASMASQANAQ
jgi:hypothetical protein